MRIQITYIIYIYISRPVLALNTFPPWKKRRILQTSGNSTSCVEILNSCWGALCKLQKPANEKVKPPRIHIWSQLEGVLRFQIENLALHWVPSIDSFWQRIRYLRSSTCCYISHQNLGRMKSINVAFKSLSSRKTCPCLQGLLTQWLKCSTSQLFRHFRGLHSIKSLMSISSTSYAYANGTFAELKLCWLSTCMNRPVCHVYEQTLLSKLRLSQKQSCLMMFNVLYHKGCNNYVAITWRIVWYVDLHLFRCISLLPDLLVGTCITSLSSGWDCEESSHQQLTALQINWSNWPIPKKQMYNLFFVSSWLH